MPNTSKTRWEEPTDFSLILGGPLYQLFLRTQLARPPLELMHRRMAAFVVLTWVPLLALSTWAGTVFSGADVPFVRDIANHARFLIALPLFILAERMVHQRLQPLIKQFINRDLIPPAELARFNAAIASARHLRNSIVVEICFLLLTFTLGHMAWRQMTFTAGSTWYGISTPGGLQLTNAGVWLAWVSMPAFQFIFLRWYYRLFIWTRFLWQVSRIRLNLMPTHPDQAGGIGFLAASVPAFAPVLIAQSAVLAGLMAGKIFFEGASLVAFKLDMVGIMAFQALLFLGPLCVFTPQMAAARRRTWGEYGTLAMRYVEAFDQKWNRNTPGEEMLGSGDIQSLADLGNSYRVISDMRIVPFSKESFMNVIGASLLPIAPLVLTIIPLDELITKLLGIPF